MARLPGHGRHVVGTEAEAQHLALAGLQVDADERLELARWPAGSDGVVSQVDLDYVVTAKCFTLAITLR